jgi:hypothetical protein
MRTTKELYCWPSGKIATTSFGRSWRRVRERLPKKGKSCGSFRTLQADTFDILQTGSGKESMGLSLLPQMLPNIPRVD